MSLTAIDAEPEQLVMFEGLWVTRVRNKVTGIKDFDSTHRGELLLLKPGDQVTVTVTCVVESIPIKEKHNAAGMAIGPITREQVLKALDGTAEVLSVTTREDIQAAWDAKVQRG